MSLYEKIRIYELSRDLNLDNKDILDAAQKLSIPIKSHSSSISLNDAKKIKEFINNSNKNNPTRQQKEVINWISQGYGNCIVSSVAGSGKSTTIIQCIKEIPLEDKVYVLSFNKKIAQSMRSKIAKQIPERSLNRDKVNLTNKTQVRTFHALGAFLLDGKLKEFKNNKLLDELTKNFYAHKLEIYKRELQKFRESGFSEINPKPVKPKLRFLFKTLEEYFRLSQLNLIDDKTSKAEIIKFIQFYKIDIDLKKDLDLIVKFSKIYFQKTTDIYERFSDITFDEMLYLPIRCEKTYFSPFKWIFIDECQDLNKAAIELIKKIGNKNSRFIFVGDEDQSINGFAGADIRSIDQIKKAFNPKLFELTNTFRCSKQITNFAKRYVSRINCFDNMEEGCVKKIKNFENMPELTIKDAILARNHASLITCAIKLLREGKDFNFPEKIQQKFKNDLNDLKEFFKQDDFNKNIISQLQSIIQEETDSIELNGCSKEKVERIQFCETLSKLCEKDKSIKTFKDLNDFLNKIISREKGPLLSTIHTQKGEEFEKVIIADFDLMPSSYPNEPEWQAIQEMNVLYVAVTRAKSELYLNAIENEGIKSFDIYDAVQKPKVNESEFKERERKANLENVKINKKIKITQEAINLRITSGIDRFVEGHEFQYGAKFYRIVKKGGDIIIACSLLDYTFKSFRLINHELISNSKNNNVINSIKDFLLTRKSFDGNPIGIFEKPSFATKDAIKSEWTNLRREWDPKENTNPIAQEIFDFINAAYNKAIKTLGKYNL